MKSCKIGLEFFGALGRMRRPPIQCSPSPVRLRVKSGSANCWTRQKNQLKQNSVSLRRNTRCVRCDEWRTIMEYQGRLYYMPGKRFGSGRVNCWNSALIDYRREPSEKPFRYKAWSWWSGHFLTEPKSSGWTDCRMDAFARRQMWNLLKSWISKSLPSSDNALYDEETPGPCVGFLWWTSGGNRCPGHMIEDAGAVCGRWDFTRWAEITLFHGKEEGNSVFIRNQNRETALRSTTLEDTISGRQSGSSWNAGQKCYSYCVMGKWVEFRRIFIKITLAAMIASYIWCLSWNPDFMSHGQSYLNFHPRLPDSGVTICWPQANGRNF